MNCEKCNSRMSDAATDALSASARLEFDAHVRECAGCREEFARVRGLLEAIDRGVVAQSAAEPSPEFVARVRRRIAAESAPRQAGWMQWAPAAAAVVVVVIAAGLWMMRPKTNVSRHVATNAPAIKQPMAVKSAPSPKSEFASVRRATMPKRAQSERGPEVLVPSGQGKALLQFVSLLRSGKLDGAKLIAEQQKDGQLAEIKPLEIAPLESSTEEENKSSGPGSNGRQKDFVSGTPIPSLER